MPSLTILVSTVLVLSCGQTDIETESRNHGITEADDRCTHATTVGVSNKGKQTIIQVSSYLDNESTASAEAQVVSGDVTLQSNVTGQVSSGHHSQASCPHIHYVT